MKSLLPDSSSSAAIVIEQDAQPLYGLPIRSTIFDVTVFLKQSRVALSISLIACLFLSSGFKQAASAVPHYKDLVIGPISFTNVSLCVHDNDYPRELCGEEQAPRTIWAFSIKNKGKSAYRNVRAEIVLQNETKADLYNNILLITSRIEPGETLWVAPEVNSGSPFVFGEWYGGVFLDLTPQGRFEGVSQGNVKIVSAKKAQPSRYRIKGYAKGELGSISDEVARYIPQLSNFPIGSTVKGIFKEDAFSLTASLPVAVDSSRVQSQWITVLLKESDGTIAGGFRFKNLKDWGPPYKAILMHDKATLKRFISAEVHVSRR